MPGAVWIDDHLAGALEQRPQPLRRRRVADPQDELRDGGLAKALDRQEGVVVRHHGTAGSLRTAPEAGGRLRQCGPAGDSGQAGHRACRVVRTPHRPADDEPAPRLYDGVRELAQTGRLRGRPGLRRPHPRRPVLPPRPHLGVELLRHRRERLAQREVQVHRSRTAGRGRVVGAARERPVVDRARATRLVRADLDEPLRE